MSDIIDLDALLSPSTTVRWQGQELKFSAPSVEDLLLIGQASDGLKTADKMNAEQLKQGLQNLRVIFWRLIPELNNVDLNMNQLLALVTATSDMVTPEETKDLAQRGITPETGDEKKN